MTYRIAVASSDGKMVNQHFGRATSFALFQVETGGEYQLLGLYDCPAACDEGFDGPVTVLTGCHAVLACRFGPEAQLALKRRGIEPMEVVKLIPEALMVAARRLCEAEGFGPS